MGRKKQDIHQRFWKFVDVLGGVAGCMLWRGAKDQDGYGLFQWGVEDTRRAHRIAYAWNQGCDLAPSELHVMHSCDTPSCVNPEHLSLGTPKDNTQDMIKKGRYRTLVGEEHPSAKLRKADATRIRSSTLSAGDLAREFGVSRSTVYDIRHNRIWTQP